MEKLRWTGINGSGGDRSHIPGKLYHWRTGQVVGLDWAVTTAENSDEKLRYNDSSLNNSYNNGHSNRHYFIISIFLLFNRRNFEYF